MSASSIQQNQWFRAQQISSCTPLQGAATWWINRHYLRAIVHLVWKFRDQSRKHCLKGTDSGDDKQYAGRVARFAVTCFMLSCCSETELKREFEHLRSLFEEQLANTENVPRPQVSSSQYVSVVNYQFIYCEK